MLNILLPVPFLDCGHQRSKFNWKIPARSGGGSKVCQLNCLQSPLFTFPVHIFQVLAKFGLTKLFISTSADDMFQRQLT